MIRLTTAIALVLLSASPVFAQPDVMLYEATEDMRLTASHRQATSALMGFAAVNTPLCPPSLTSPQGGDMCVVNATGSNNIKLSSGIGPVHGDFRVVTQDANPFDIEEVVELRGDFRGTMDLSLTGVTGLGTMDATLTVEGGKGNKGKKGNRGNTPFRGVVRIPVPCGTDFCYVTSGPDGSPTGVQPLESHEYALGRPMVRLDIYFE
jgi:hypothetical protein